MVIVNGRVVRDLEISATTAGKQYITFDVAEDVGFGEKQTTVFHRCTIWNEDMVNRIVNAKVKKGSSVQIVGEQTISAFTRNNGEAGAQSNVNVWNWSYLPISSKKADDTAKAGTSGTYSDTPTEDCDDGLPA